MVGQAVVRALHHRGARSLIMPTREELNLIDQAAVQRFFRDQRPQLVIFAAGKVGGIIANQTFQAEFLYENMMMTANAIESARQANVQRFLYLGSSCIYPKMAPQPINEASLLASPLEPTNEGYALAKITGLKLCQYYRQQFGCLFHSAMPTNLYGPGDNYHAENSHVVPGLIRRFHDAKQADQPQVTIWGTGTVRRELMHVDDLADGLLHLCQISDPPDWVNVGTGQDVTIMQLAELIADVIGYRGKIITDPSKPDGTPIKQTDISLINRLGWEAKIELRAGLEMTYQAFLRESTAGVLREK